jgi:hypothetical protein
MSFIPNNVAYLSRQMATNVYAESVFGPRQKVECGVVKLNQNAKQTSVRADSSASRGTIEEEVVAAKILFLPTASPNIGDKIEINGVTLRCTAQHPRFAVTGILDHHECDLEIWPA